MNRVKGGGMNSRWSYIHLVLFIHLLIQYVCMSVINLDIIFLKINKKSYLSTFLSQELIFLHESGSRPPLAGFNITLSLNLGGHIAKLFMFSKIVFQIKYKEEFFGNFDNSTSS